MWGKVSNPPVQVKYLLVLQNIPFISPDCFISAVV
jgi:hypothetical protein